MPYVHIRITDEGVTAAHKAALIEGVTRLLQEVLGKNPATTVVVIDRQLGHRWRDGHGSPSARPVSGPPAADGPLGNTGRMPWDNCR